ncbi:hypothetical protein PC9H_002773 [Pleurotus ostreatus]|uniref:Uncharacterized protein n=1 Tax=Pleurotus ostreatus TaxID=5322 RepID=A0A8H6ZLD4_PLEOS|nr:uncharacterized protein PC9H_002773 [Pleurotus ostreatus]KAF7416048.1 hypothetical protein PC9H_002773 [Pleurotus ostreatus]
MHSARTMRKSGKKRDRYSSETWRACTGRLSTGNESVQRVQCLKKCELRNNDIVQFGVDFVDENDEYHHKIAARVFCIFKSEDMQVALRSYNENPQDAVPPDDEGLQAPLHPDNADLQGSLPSEDAAVSPGVGPSPASTEDVRPLKSETDFVSSEDIDPFKSEADFVSSEAEKSFFDFSSNDCDGDDNEGFLDGQIRPCVYPQGVVVDAGGNIL